MKQEEIIKSLTLEQKCALLAGGTTFGSRGFPSKGVPAFLMSDGPHGLRKQAGAADHLGIAGSEPATCFPPAGTMANSWDTALGVKNGSALEMPAPGLGSARGFERKGGENAALRDEAVELAKKADVVLFFSGSAAEVPWIDKARAFVYAGLGGQAGAGALLDVVEGKLNPSGKLTETWPMTYADTPAQNFPSQVKTSEYREATMGRRASRSASPSASA